MAIEIKNNNTPNQGSVDGNGEQKVNTLTPPVENNEDLEGSYTDKRSVTISLVKNYSAYRKLNMKVLGQRHEVIGSSVTSCRVLSSNKGEVDCYFPQLIGLSPSNPEFISRVKAYLSNTVEKIENKSVILKSGEILTPECVLLAVGRKPSEESIARQFDGACIGDACGKIQLAHFAIKQAAKEIGNIDDVAVNKIDLFT